MFFAGLSCSKLSYTRETSQLFNILPGKKINDQNSITIYY